MNDMKEALWVVAMAGIGMLFVIIFYQSGQVIAEYTEMGEASISGTFWVCVAVALSLCAMVPYLLKDSKGLPFKLIAILLTAITPAVTVVLVVANVWQVIHQ